MSFSEIRSHGGHRAMPQCCMLGCDGHCGLSAHSQGKLALRESLERCFFPKPWESQKRQMHRKTPQDVTLGKEWLATHHKPPGLPKPWWAWLVRLRPLVEENRALGVHKRSAALHWHREAQTSKMESADATEGRDGCSWPPCIPPSFCQREKECQTTAWHYWWGRMQEINASFVRGFVQIIKFCW